MNAALLLSAIAPFVQSESLAEGLTGGLTVTTDASVVASGGLERTSAVRSLVDLELGVDLERLWGLDGLSLYTRVQAFGGPDGSADTGDVQIYSNIDGEELQQLAELWLAWEPALDTRLLLGKVEANNHFALLEQGVDFVHSSAGFTPTIFPLPSYPDTAVALLALHAPERGLGLRAGLFTAEDGGAVSGRRGLSARFDERFAVAEARWRADGWELSAGAWHHSGTFGRFSGGSRRGTGGGYAGFATRFGTDERPVDLFLQLSAAADDDVAVIDEHAAAGVRLDGWLGPEGWSTGFYASHASVSSGLGGGAETAFELFQRIPLGEHLVLQPDVQLIVDPSGRDFIDDAWVFTLRAMLSY